MNKFTKTILLGICLSMIAQTALSTDVIDHESTLNPIIEESQANKSEISKVDLTDAEEFQVSGSEISKTNVTEVNEDSHLNKLDNVTELNEDSHLNISKTSNEHISEIKKDSNSNNSEVHTERDHVSEHSSSDQTHHLDINHTEHTNDLLQKIQDHVSQPQTPSNKTKSSENNNTELTIDALQEILEAEKEYSDSNENSEKQGDTTGTGNKDVDEDDSWVDEIDNELKAIDNDSTDIDNIKAKKTPLSDIEQDNNAKIEILEITAENTVSYTEMQIIVSYMEDELKIEKPQKKEGEKSTIIMDNFEERKKNLDPNSLGDISVLEKFIRTKSPKSQKDLHDKLIETLEGVSELTNDSGSIDSSMNTSERALSKNEFDTKNIESESQLKKDTQELEDIIAKSGGAPLTGSQKRGDALSDLKAVMNPSGGDFNLDNLKMNDFMTMLSGKKNNGGSNPNAANPLVGLMQNLASKMGTMAPGQGNMNNNGANPLAGLMQNLTAAMSANGNANNTDNGNQATQLNALLQNLGQALGKGGASGMGQDNQQQSGLMKNIGQPRIGTDPSMAGAFDKLRKSFKNTSSDDWKDNKAGGNLLNQLMSKNNEDMDLMSKPASSKIPNPKLKAQDDEMEKLRRSVNEKMNPAIKRAAENIRQAGIEAKKAGIDIYKRQSFGDMPINNKEILERSKKCKWKLNRKKLIDAAWERKLAKEKEMKEMAKKKAENGGLYNKPKNMIMNSFNREHYKKNTVRILI